MENILENNKIIAEFMSYEGQHEDWCGNNIIDNDDFQGEACVLLDLKRTGMI